MSISIVYTLEGQLHHYIVSNGYSLDNADYARIHKQKALQSYRTFPLLSMLQRHLLRSEIVLSPCLNSTLYHLISENTIQKIKEMLLYLLRTFSKAGLVALYRHC